MTVIAIDLDDTVLDFTGTWKRLYRLWFDHEPDEQQNWDILGAPQFASKPEFFAWFDMIGGWDEIGYLPGAPGAILSLSKRYTVHFATARDRRASMQAAQDWWRHELWYRSTFLTCNPNKETVKAAVYVDDSPLVAQRLLDLGRKVVLIDRPWNRDFGHESDQWVCVQNWAQTVDAVDAFVRGEHPNIPARLDLVFDTVLDRAVPRKVRK